MTPAAPPAPAYEAIWCAWGYERDCTTQLIEGTLPKVRELGLRWAVIDDGWQAMIGDWNPHRDKYPNGDADMRRLVSGIRAAGLKPRLWCSPLSAAPGSDLLHDHIDMLLLDKEGAAAKHVLVEQLLSLPRLRNPLHTRRIGARSSSANGDLPDSKSTASI